jgi:spermidine synthase
VLVSERTAHQELIIFENALFGRVLMLDGTIQLTTADEFVYHEMMAHVPLLAHGAAARVLIVGGGDGGIAREVLKHPGVEALTMVEIDRAVVNLCAAHFPEVSGGAFADPRLSLVIADGIEYARSSEDRYDIVVVDSTDPVGPAAGLFTASFYADCKRLLRKGGVLVTQSGVPFVQREVLRDSIANLGASFADAICYLSAVPTYTGGFLAHGWGSDDATRRTVAPEVLARRFAASGIATRYYTPAVHAAAFALPRFVAETVAEGLGRR